MLSPTAKKDPDDRRLYVMDWSKWLGDLLVIVDSQWFVKGNDNSLITSSASVLSGERATQVLLSGGTLKQKYTVTNRITTNGTPAQVKDQSFRVLIAEQ